MTFPMTFNSLGSNKREKNVYIYMYIQGIRKHGTKLYTTYHWDRLDETKKVLYKLKLMFAKYFIEKINMNIQRNIKSFYRYHLYQSFQDSYK